jgi:hypothetical protein
MADVAHLIQDGNLDEAMTLPLMNGYPSLWQSGCGTGGPLTRPRDAAR